MADEAMSTLSRYEGEVQTISKQVEDLERLLKERLQISGRQEWESVLDGLAQSQQQLHRLQSEGIDAITASSINERRDEVLEMKERLNERVEDVLSRVETAMAAVRNNCPLSVMERRRSGIPPLAPVETGVPAASGPEAELNRCDSPMDVETIEQTRIRRLASGDQGPVDDSELAKVVELVAASPRPEMEAPTALPPAKDAPARLKRDKESDVVNGEVLSRDASQSSDLDEFIEMEMEKAAEELEPAKTVAGDLTIGPDDVITDQSIASNALLEEASTEESRATPVSTFYAWGRGEQGQLLMAEDRINYARPHRSARLSKYDIVGASCSLLHSFVWTRTGEVIGGGSNNEGQIVPDKKEEFISPPRLVESLLATRIVQVSCGIYHSACLTSDGIVITYGGNEFGQLGHSRGTLQNVQPRTMEGPMRNRKARAVACGELSTLILSTRGEVFAAGLGYSDLNLDGTTPTSVSPHGVNSGMVIPVKGLYGVPIVQIAAGNNHSLALSSSGNVYSWGRNDCGQLGIKSNIISVSPSRPPRIDRQIHEPQRLELTFKVAAIACGGLHSALISEEDGGTLYSFGKNTRGQLGHRTATASVNTPKVVDALRKFCVVQVACGQSHTLALVRNKEGKGSIWSFGSGEFGQLGNSDVSDKSLPVLVDSLTDKPISFIAAGGDHSMAVVCSQPGEDIPRPLVPARANGAGMCRELSVEEVTRVLAKVRDLFTLRRETRSSIRKSEKCVALAKSVLIMGYIGDGHKAGVLAVHQGSESRTTVAKEDVIKFSNDIRLVSFAGQADSTGSPAELLYYLQECFSSPQILNRSFMVPSLTEKDNLENAGSSSLAVHVESVERFFGLVFTPTLKQLMMCFRSNYPPHIFGSRIVGPLQKHMSYHLHREQGAGRAVPMIGRLLHMLYLVNDQAKLIGHERFYNEAVSSLPDQSLQVDYINWRNNPDPTKAFTFCAHPFLLSADAKRRLLHFEAAIQMNTQAQQAVSLSILGFQLGNPFFILKVRRDHLLQDTLAQISFAGPNEMKKKLKVIFHGEEGVDEGGVKKEFFQLLVHQLFDPSYGMFVYIEETRCIWFNKNSLESESEYFLIGCILGLAIYNGVILDVHFPIVVYRLLLRRPVTIEDVASIDPALYKGLKQLLEYTGDDVEDIFCRTFEVTYEFLGQTYSYELVPGGNQKPVTSVNKGEYVERYVQWLLKESIAVQFDAFARGFLMVVGGPVLNTFRAEELELLVAGTPHLDMKDLERVTLYDGGYTAAHSVIRWFWEIVQGFDLTHQQKLLMFTTGSKRAPIGGLSKLAFKIHRAGPDSAQLPTAHTCFNTLMLPEYSSKEKLRKQLLLAINECEGFGLM